MATYNLKNAGVWVEVIRKDMRKAAESGLLAAAHKTVAHIQNEVIPQTEGLGTDRGIYRAGWRAMKVSGGADVMNRVPHAVFIEYGVRAGNVKIGRKMIDALTEWVRRKGIGGHTEFGGLGGRTKHVKATDAEARSIAFAIANKLKKTGIFNGGKGFKVLARASQMIPQFIREEVQRELRKAIG